MYNKGMKTLLTIVMLCLVIALPEPLPPVELSSIGIAALTASVSSVLLSILPGLREWWDTYTYKREAMLGVGFLTAWAIVGLHYAGAGQISYTAQKWGK